MRICFRFLLLAVTLLAASSPEAAAEASDHPVDEAWIRDHYRKQEVMVPMRDGVELFTSIYAPRDEARRHPFLMRRTPYSVRPYGEGDFPSRLGPSDRFPRDGYIFVFQDVRGTYMSEGEFVNMRPHIAEKTGPERVDESSDTYDTIEWLLANVPNHNGKVGMWGVSYSGFYCAAGMADAHPALIAVSPQAPIADWWFDDFHHHGALFLPHAFNFLSSFGRARPEPTTERSGRFDHGTPDGYQFFLDLGPLKNADTEHLKGEVAFWNEICAHPNYDEFWRSRNILPHLKNVAPAVMTVGGWFDAEDLYGPLSIYREVERMNPDVFNVLVMGPWSHGGWSRSSGDRTGNARFGAKTSEFYRQHVEHPFFDHFLQGKGELDLPEALVFETGRNEWRDFEEWPPAVAASRSFHFHRDGVLSETPVSDAAPAFDAFVSDPDKPVPFTEAINKGMTRNYMTDDQRFAARRPDVLVYQTPVLEEPTTFAGPIVAELFVSTTGSAADWIVKLIDVLPPDAEDPKDLPAGRRMGNYHMMVRSEVIRGRFRNGYERPEPFVPDEVAKVRLPLQDVLHTFQPGHRIMIQIQSTWFPLVDRNPQRYVDNIFEAEESDFITATHRVHRSAENPSHIRALVLPASGE